MASALATFKQYNDAFRALDPTAIAPFFHLPSVMLTPRGDHAFHTANEVVRMYAQVMAGLKEQRYRTTIFDQLDEDPIAQNLAAVHGVGRWENLDGAIFSRFEASYVLRQSDAWKIVLATIRAIE